jgi:hypothetical protein
MVERMILYRDSDQLVTLLVSYIYNPTIYEDVCEREGTLFIKGDNIFVACFLLGNSPTSEFYMPTFRNTLSVPYS